MIKLDARRARDLSRMLTAATGLTWFADALERAVRLITAEEAR